MTDRDEVIKGLKSTREFICATKSMFETGFPNIVTDVYDNAINAISEALELLKEQEPVEPYVTGNGPTFESATRWWYACGHCNKPIDVNDKHCRHCGRAVKWDD